MCIRTALQVLLCISLHSVAAFVPSAFPASTPRSTAVYAPQASPQSALEGMHGVGSRYLPIEQAEETEYFPRMVQIAGVLNEMTPDDVMAVSSSPAAGPGMWNYDFSDPTGPQLGIVALPGSLLVTEMIDPVAMIAYNNELNIQLARGWLRDLLSFYHKHCGILTISAEDNAEVLVVVDRGEIEFEIGKFFLWADPAGKLLVRWMNSAPPPEYTCMGRVKTVFIPFLPSMQKEQTGWMEEDEY